MLTVTQRLRELQLKHGKRFGPAFTQEFGCVWQKVKTDEEKHKVLDELNVLLSVPSS